MPTIRDVARRAGVSTATVSAVINDSAYVSPKLRRQVVDAIAALNYRPSQAARSLKKGRSQLIAMIVADLFNPFFGRVVACAEVAASSWGHALVLFNSDEKPENERKALERARALGCDGVILVPVDSSAAYQKVRLGPALPAVLFGRRVEGDLFDCVELDNFAAGYRATRHLLDIGHQRIGTIHGPLKFSTALGRLDGMKAALRERNVVLDDRWVRCGEFREDAAFSVAKEMMVREGRPSALYVANGVMAIGVMRALDGLGLDCPRDVSIASTDPLPGLGGLKPRLTRTEHPVALMTDEALRLLMDRLSTDPNLQPRNVVFQPELIVGDSCMPATKVAEDGRSPA